MKITSILIVSWWVLGFFVCAKLFEYSLWVLTGKDVVWYMDLLGGVICNGFLVPISFVLWLMTNTLGYTIPILH